MLEAYTIMDKDRAAVLIHYSTTWRNPTEAYHHLKGLYLRWIWPEQHTKEEVGETIILEQLLREMGK